MPTTTPQSAEMSLFQSYIFKSRYARWLPEESRREDWPETVRRYMSFILERIPEEHRGIGPELEDAILRMEVMPSMRAMMTAGRALVKDEIAGYNCAYMAIDDPRCFDEAMYISMCGVGLGFSVERQYIKCLPTIAESFYDEDTVIKVRDSKIGWATGFRQLIALLYGGWSPGGTSPWCARQAPSSRPSAGGPPARSRSAACSSSPSSCSGAQRAAS